MIDPHIFIPVARAAEQAATSSPAATLGLKTLSFLGQLVNFSILLLIFWKWILPRVTKGLKERTERIEKALNDAERVAKEKQEFEVWRQAEMTKSRQEASSIITEAQTEAGKARQQILEQAKHDQQKLVDQAKSQIESEKQKALSEAKGEIANMVTTAAEKILRKKLDGKADQELIKGSLTSIK